MATILRASSASVDPRQTRDSLNDVAAMAEAARRCWEQAQAESTALLEQARTDADRLRREALDEGRRQGRAEAEEEIRSELGRQLAEAPATWDQIVAELRRAQHEWIARWEQDALRLACAIAARVVRRESVAEPRLTCGLIREALELAAGRQQVRLQLHPADLALLGDEVRQLLVSLGRQTSVELQADNSLEPGGCRVITEHGEIDQQWSVQLARIAEELGVP